MMNDIFETSENWNFEDPVIGLHGLGKDFMMFLYKIVEILYIFRTTFIYFYTLL